MVTGTDFNGGRSGASTDFTGIHLHFGDGQYAVGVVDLITRTDVGPETWAIG